MADMPIIVTLLIGLLFKLSGPVELRPLPDISPDAVIVPPLIVVTLPSIAPIVALLAVRVVVAVGPAKIVDAISVLVVIEDCDAIWVAPRLVVRIVEALIIFALDRF